MKRVITGLLLGAALLGLGSAQVGAATESGTALPSPRIVLDGLPLSFPVPPVIVEGRTMVPFRAIAEALGAEVFWHGETRSIRATGLNMEVSLRIDEKTMWVNGLPVQLDVAPQIVNGSTMVPLRAFSTAFQAKVGWDQGTQTAAVVSPVRPMRTLAFYALRAYPERQYVPRFSDVAYGWATLTSEGRIDLDGGEYKWPQPDGDVTGERLLTEAAGARTRRHLMIHAVDGKTNLTALVQDGKRISRVAAEVATVVKEKNFDGVVLDLEQLGHLNDSADRQRVREGFVRLVEAVSREIRSLGKETIVSVHPLNGWFLGYDYPAIAAHADLLQLMAHDYAQDGNPEPAGKVEEAIRLALEQVPRNKLLLGIVAPYETVETLPQKAGLAKRYSLRGISIWRLGEIGDERMATLDGTVSPLK